MARAKNTDRAQARRRHREEQRALDPDIDDLAIDEAPAAAAAAPSGPSLGNAMRGSFRMPNIREDLRILPGMLLHTRKLWIPFIVLIVAFVFAMLLPEVRTIMVGGQQIAVELPGMLPDGFESIAALFVQLTLVPTALFIFFIGGFLAPRASYLVGAVLGIFDGILWAIYVFSRGTSTESTDGFRVAGVVDFLAIIFIAMVIGILAAGFAAWYRNFLRQSQERARQNRIAREQAMRAKAKEDERKAKEEQRKAAVAAREARSASKASSKGNPPAG